MPNPIATTDLWRSETFTFYIHRDYAAWIFPWWGTMAHGIGKVGGAGGGVWHSRDRERLIRKMSRSATKLHHQWGSPDAPEIEVVDRYQGDH